MTDLSVVLAYAWLDATLYAFFLILAVRHLDRKERERNRLREELIDVD